MAKLTRTQVLELMDEFGEIEAKIAKADRAKNRAMDPLIEAHNEACKPILEKFDKAVNPLNARKAEIEKTVFGYLEQQGKDQVIITQDGVVALQNTETKIGQRVIDPEKFFKTVKSKGAEFWNCLKVGIKEAEKFLGKNEVDKIADKKETTVVIRTLTVEQK